MKIAPAEGGPARDHRQLARAGPFYSSPEPAMVFRTRPKRRVLNDLVAKLEILPANDPDRPQLIRVINSLRRELAYGPPIQGELFD